MVGPWGGHCDCVCGEASNCRHISNELGCTTVFTDTAANPVNMLTAMFMDFPRQMKGAKLEHMTQFIKKLMSWQDIVNQRFQIQQDNKFSFNWVQAMTQKQQQMCE